MLRLVTALPDPRRRTVKVLGVDDFAFRRGRDYGTVLINAETGRPVDLLRDREAKRWPDGCGGHPGTEVICRDRAGAYADGARKGAPDAIQVADHGISTTTLPSTWRKRSPGTGTASKSQSPSRGQEPPAGDETAASPEASRSRRHADQRAEDSALAVRTRQRYEQVQALKAQGKGIKPIMRETGLAKETVRRFYRAWRRR